MSYEGNCHCGAVTFVVDADVPTEAIECNCSHCRAKGLLLAFVPSSQFRLTSGEANLRSYKFNTHRIDHKFCTTCGVEAFAYGTSPDGADTRAINLRSVPALDLDGLKKHAFDGASK